jgi:hypothetical protein
MDDLYRECELAGAETMNTLDTAPQLKTVALNIVTAKLTVSQKPCSSMHLWFYRPELIGAHWRAWRDCSHGGRGILGGGGGHGGLDSLSSFGRSTNLQPSSHLPGYILHFFWSTLLGMQTVERNFLEQQEREHFQRAYLLCMHIYAVTALPCCLWVSQTTCQYLRNPWHFLQAEPGHLLYEGHWGCISLPNSCCQNSGVSPSSIPRSHKQ